ncbi:MAG: hypothetical protein Q8O72_08205 [Bacteroidales bacterium]|nr:hypothetical protein [Bacteroidales bacterium]
MKNIQLTRFQVEICDIILKNNNRHIKDILDYKKYSKVDIQISAKTLNDQKLISNYNPIVITDTGAQYSEKGIVKFLRNKRRNDLLSSPLFKTWFLIIPIVISLVFNVINFCQNQENKTDNSQFLKKSELDSLIDIKLKLFENISVKDSSILNDTIVNIDK